MAKTFKRIAALALALTLVVCFAVSASAAPTVATTTQYVAGDTTKVNVSVSIIDNDADYVTYYATKDGEVVYVDQADLRSSGSATINYQTAEGNLGGTVKVGYTNGATALDKSIDSYTVSAGSYAVTPSVIPTTGNATVTISGYVASENMKFKDVSADNADAASTLSQDGSTITVTLSNIEGNVTLAVNEVANTQTVAATAIHLASAGVTVTADTIDPDDYAKADDTRITVIGAVKNVAGDDFGVIISSEVIADTTAADLSAYDAWAAEVKNPQGAFAVQIIDDGTVFKAGTYYTAVYAKNSDGTYTVTAGDSFTVGQ